MAIKLATLNMKFSDGENSNETILAMEQVLIDAANDSDAEDFEIFYLESDRVLSISFPFEEDCFLELLEAGVVLGNCQQQIMDSDLVRCLSFWKSVDALDGTTIASPI